ncbi:antitoxin [Mycobacterium riyadhense]|uniref:Antitoxin VapB25 n=1 Tax=Mycobacterium riyadhense TaxID=486698 RepID=A0A653EES9_9MYCO|nr:antitoxin [Mycobacterium riyadhense]VTO96014.1 Antitoxin VapB25 [Mycobacterium riyadhense]
MRTTIDLDDDILRALKQRQREERKPLGQLVSELLARALAAKPHPSVDIRWATADLRPRVDLDDKDAVGAVLDRPIER